jgi:hypothetical protein
MPAWLALNLTALAAMVGLLHASSAPGLFVLEAFACALLCFAIGVIWLTSFSIFAVRTSRQGRFLADFKKTFLRWAFAPAVGLITVVLICLDAPLRLRFAVSQCELNRLAQQSLTAGPMPLTACWTPAPVHRAGAYHVVVMQVTAAGEVDFRVPGTEFMRSYGGFTYCPNGLPDDPEGSFVPLGGPWYRWHTSW